MSRTPPASRTRSVFRRRHRTLAALVAALTIVLLSGCAGSGGDPAATGGGPEKLELSYQGNANAVHLAELAEDLGYLGAVKLNWIGNTISGPQDIQSAATGQTDFGGAFNGAVVKLIASGAPITAVISYYGVDDKTFNGFYVPEDSPIRTARDLIGKKVGVNTARRARRGRARTPGCAERADPGGDRAGRAPRRAADQHRADAAPAARSTSASLGGVLQDKAVAAAGCGRCSPTSSCSGPFNAGSYVLRNDFIEENPRHRRDPRHRGRQGDRVGARTHRATRSSPGSPRSSRSAAATRAPTTCSSGRAPVSLPAAA